VYQKPNVYEEQPQGIKSTYFGLDWGFAQDVCAVVKVQTRDKEIWVEEVLYEAGLTNEDLSFILKDRGLTRMENIVADSSEPKSITELNRSGLNVRGVKKGAGSVLFGIQKLRQFKINVHKDSHNLINEFTNYRYKKDRQGRVTNQTEGDDHALDALRYVVTEFLDTKQSKFTFV
jgi:phage terminase large subunit